MSNAPRSRKITKNWHLELAIDFRNLDRGSFRKEKQILVPGISKLDF